MSIENKYMKTTGGIVKVTSYNVSKKLAEIGFKADPFFYRQECNKENFIIDATGVYDCAAVRCYDLETILDALPNSYQIFSNFLLNAETFLIGKSIIYQSEEYNCWIKQENNESLADTAARLLILLVEKGIINFNK